MSARISMMATIVLLGTIAGWSQTQPKVTVQQAPIQNVTPSSGVEMYKSYCAACHGLTGKGNGPAAPAFKTAPTDLTLLAKRNNGQFPEMHVAEVLKGGTSWQAHGSAEMPVWGPLFSAVSANQSIVELRVRNLAQYVQSLQAK